MLSCCLGDWFQVVAEHATVILQMVIQNACMHACAVVGCRYHATVIHEL